MAKVASAPPAPGGRTRCESPRCESSETLKEPSSEPSMSFRSPSRRSLQESSMSFRSRARFAGLTRTRTSTRLLQAASMFSRKRKTLVSEDFKRRSMIISTQLKQRDKDRVFVIDPRESSLLSAWDGVTTFALVYTALLTPFEVSDVVYLSCRAAFAAAHSCLVGPPSPVRWASFR